MANKSDLRVIYRDPAELIPYARNARTHSPEQIAKLAASIKEFGFTTPVELDGENGILSGHGRVLAAQKLGLKRIPTIDLSGLTEAQRRAYILAANRLALDAGWDEELLKLEIEELQAADFDVGLTGFQPEELGDILTEKTEIEGYEERANAGALNERYVVPPFSVLDTRQGYWRERAAEWREKIGDSGESRDEAFFPKGERSVVSTMAGVSLLDPVLAEVICKWFLPSASAGGCKCCDPFAGDTVFGYVCASLGNTFTGVELRQEQADLNNARCAELPARYICDDGQNIAQHIEPETQDLVFSCPPYFDLEKYSDLPNDASNQDWAGFCAILRNALAGAMACLKPNRFAVVVMSNVRDRKGFYLDICEQIKQVMQQCGARLYNELVLVNSCGTGALRANSVFRKRKVVRLHQEVLVFYKGDPKAISEDFPVIEVPEDASED